MGISLDDYKALMSIEKEIRKNIIEVGTVKTPQLGMIASYLIEYDALEFCWKLHLRVQLKTSISTDTKIKDLEDSFKIYNTETLAEKEKIDFINESLCSMLSKELTREIFLSSQGKIWKA